MRLSENPGRVARLRGTKQQLAIGKKEDHYLLPQSSVIPYNHSMAYVHVTEYCF